MGGATKKDITRVFTKNNENVVASIGGACRSWLRNFFLIDVGQLTINSNHCCIKLSLLLLLPLPEDPEAPDAPGEASLLFI